MDDLALLTTFRFLVEFDQVDGSPGEPLSDGGFQEVSGLDIEMEVVDYEEGGVNDAVIRRIGRAKYQPLVCKRGMIAPAGGTAKNEFWKWLQDTIAGVRPIRRYDGTVIVRNQAGEDTARWRFVNAVPTKIVGPQLNATSGEVAMEELHLAHEGLLLEGAT